MRKNKTTDFTISDHQDFGNSFNALLEIFSFSGVKDGVFKFLFIEGKSWLCTFSGSCTYKI